MSTELSGHFFEEKIKMANIFLEKHRSFSAIREMQIKTIRHQSLTSQNDYH